MARQEGGQCSIGLVKAFTAWLTALRRRVRPAPEGPSEAEDPRAQELRQKLEESRAVVEEQHEEAASPEVPVDQAEASVEERRAAVHERARAAAEEMRRQE